MNEKEKLTRTDLLDEVERTNLLEEIERLKDQSLEWKSTWRNTQRKLDDLKVQIRVVRKMLETL